MAKVKNKRNSGLADKVHSKRKADLNKKKLNPFEVHINKEKLKVLGKKSKHDRGLPGVSRAKAVQKRKETLGTEMKLMNKTNAFIDRRIGENGQLSAEERMIARFTAERAKQHSKKNIYNLADDEILTHRGQTLEQIEKFDDPRSDDEEDEDGRAFGGLDDEFVSEGHFGGGVLSKSDNKDGAKSHKDLIEQLIAESKKRKAEKQKEKEQTLDLTEKLDSEWKDLQPVVFKRPRLEDKKEESIIDKLLSQAEKKGEDYDKMMRELKFEKRGTPSDGLKSAEQQAKEEKERLEELERERQQRMMGEETVKVQATGKHRSADDLDDNFELEDEKEFMLSYDKDAKPLVPDHILKIFSVPKTKTKFEDGISDTSSDEDEGGDEGDESDDTEDEGDEVEDKDNQNNAAKNKDNESDETEDENKGDETNGVEDEDQNEEKKKKISDGRKVKEKNDESDETDVENEDDENDATEDKDKNFRSNITKNGVKVKDLVSPESGDESDSDISAKHEDTKKDNKLGDMQNSMKSDASFDDDQQEEGDDSDDDDETVESDENSNNDDFNDLKESEEESDSGDDKLEGNRKRDLLFDLESFARVNMTEFLEDKTPCEQSDALQELIDTDAEPGKDKKELLSVLFAHILQYINDIFTNLKKKSDVIRSFQVFDKLAPYFYDIAHINKVSTKKYISELLRKKHVIFKSNPKRVPDMDTLIFFKLISLLYPTSDFRHPVTTPSLIFMSEILTLGRFKDAYSISRGLFITALILEYTKLSKRYVPAAINFLRGILYLTANTSVLNPIQVVPPFRLHRDMKILNLTKDCSKIEIEHKMVARDLVAKEIDVRFKIRSLVTCTLMLKEFFNNCNDMEAQECIFQPHIQLLSWIDLDMYPNKIESIVSKSIQYMKECLEVKTYIPLTREKKKPKALRLYEPDVQEVFTGSKSSKLTREKAERDRLVHKHKKEMKGALREIRRDKAYIASVKIRQKIHSDNVRKEKVKQIYKEAAIQQGELNKLTRSK